MLHLYNIYQSEYKIDKNYLFEILGGVGVILLLL